MAMSGGMPPDNLMETGGTVLCQDWILTAVDSWIRKGRTREDVLPLVQKSFDLKLLREAATKL